MYATAIPAFSDHPRKSSIISKRAGKLSAVAPKRSVVLIAPHVREPPSSGQFQICIWWDMPSPHLCRPGNTRRISDGLIPVDSRALRSILGSSVLPGCTAKTKPPLSALKKTCEPFCLTRLYPALISTFTACAPFSDGYSDKGTRLWCGFGRVKANLREYRPLVLSVVEALEWGRWRRTIWPRRFHPPCARCEDAGCRRPAPGRK